MDDNAKRKRANLFWLLVLAAVVLVWWFFRPAGMGGATPQEIEADRQAAMAGADPDDILVDLVDDASDAQVSAIERDLGIHLTLVSDQSRDERFYRAHVDPARRDALIAALSARPEVETAEPDAEVFLSPEGEVTAPDESPAWEGFPDDPKYKFQWHMRQIHMPEAWKLADGDGVIVAVLDTGVAFESYKNQHKVPDLDGVEFVKPYNFVANNKHAGDDHGHGTHVTGTIAQVTHNGVGVAGIARKVKIMPLKVLSANGSGSVAGIADAIRYAADEGARVINMSLGGRFPSKVLERAVKYAHGKGVTVICAAGNDGRNKVGYPAAYPGAVAVAATQYDESTTFYSNYGKDVDIAAPGGNTKVDQNGDGMPDGVLQNTIAIGDPSHDDYYAYMGTSMASPHAAGVAALIVGEGVTDPAQVEAILKKTARAPSGGNLDKARYGAGIIDAKAAVLEARSDQGGAEFLLGILLAGAVAFGLRRKGALGVKIGAGYLGGVLVGASGLFFLPWIAGGVSSWPGVEMLTRGLPSWDLSILGVDGHGNPLFFSALLPLALAGALFGVARARPVIAGVSAGVAGHLLFHTAVRMNDVHWVPNLFGLDQLWLLGNVALCLVLAHLVLRK